MAKKDFNAPQHNEIEAVPNLQVIKAMQVRQYQVPRDKDRGGARLC